MINQLKMNYMLLTLVLASIIGLSYQIKYCDLNEKDAETFAKCVFGDYVISIY